MNRQGLLRIHNIKEKVLPNDDLGLFILQLQLTTHGKIKITDIEPFLCSK